MSSVSKNLNLVKEKIRNACLKRPVDLQNRDVRLVAVSKTKPVKDIIEAYNCGQRHFGENYVQEIGEKGFDEEIVKVCPEIKWHYIGHLQRNKVNKLLSIPNLFVVETVDTVKLADALDSGVGKIQRNFDQKLNIFVQVNTSGEEAKSGCQPDEVTAVVQHIVEYCKYLNFMGLMTIGKYDNYDPYEGINPDFQTLINCQRKVCRDLDLDINDVELSMGMSGDYEHAVEAGATNVRVGSLIFGERPTGYLQKKLAIYAQSESGDKEINRYRKVHRILKFYSNNFGFRKPYQVLVDGTLCVAALRNKINIQEQFHKYLENDIKLLTTQCIIKEMEKLGSEAFGAVLIIKKFGVHECGHGKSSVPALDCILHMIGENNPSRYIIATQDRDLQQKCHKIVGVPLLYLHSRTPVLEAPSVLSQTVANEKTASEFSVRQWDQEKLIHLNAGETVADTRKKRKRKGGPNPLSCKKKKTPKESCQKKSDHSQNKRKRNRNRLVKKIKSEILSSLNL